EITALSIVGKVSAENTLIVFETLTVTSSSTALYLASITNLGVVSFTFKSITFWQEIEIIKSKKIKLILFILFYSKIIRYRRNDFEQCHLYSLNLPRSISFKTIRKSNRKCIFSIIYVVN